VPAGLSGTGLGTGFEDIVHVRRVRRVRRVPVPGAASCSTHIPAMAGNVKKKRDKD
jgi:hypothetical protein